jgi:hypothetical protein
VENPPSAMYEHLLTLVNQYPKTFLYFGVGSCPHVHKLEDLTPKWDQLLPCFVKDIYQNKASRVQVLHVDPQFANRRDFLISYFQTHLPGSVFYEYDNLMIWESDHIQVICATQYFYHTNSYNNQEDHTWFLDSLTEEALVNGYKMVYQEYTGHEMKPLFLKLYNSCDETLQRRFRRQILFDVSYGTDTGCMTDMEKYKPFYEPNGDFLNLQLYTEQELFDRIHTHPAINEILFKTLVGKYRMILNDIHVDYRRKMNGDPCFHPNRYGYNDSSSPEQILECLHREIFIIVPQLRKIGLLNSGAVEQLQSYFDQAMTMDRYKWYDKVFNLVKFELPPFPGPQVQYQNG